MKSCSWVSLWNKVNVTQIGSETCLGSHCGDLQLEYQKMSSRTQLCPWVTSLVPAAGPIGTGERGLTPWGRSNSLTESFDLVSWKDFLSVMTSQGPVKALTRAASREMSATKPLDSCHLEESSQDPLVYLKPQAWNGR